MLDWLKWMSMGRKCKCCGDKVTFEQYKLDGMCHKCGDELCDFLNSESTLKAL